MNIKALLPLALAGTLAACGGDSSDDVILTTEQRASFAASRIVPTTQAVAACQTDGPICDAEISAITDSAFTRMSAYVPGLDMSLLETSIEAAVDYALQTDGEYADIAFRYTAPGASQGTSVVINGGLNADSYASGGSTPVINDEQGIYADEGAPLADPDGNNGWYFINDQAGKKVNWYLYADDGSAEKGYTMADLRSIMATVDVRNTNTDFFFSLYTLRENDGNDVAWYRSKVTLTSADFDVPATGEYTAEFNRDAAATADLEFTVSAGPNTVFSGTNTSIDDIGNERLFLMAFSTNSGAAVNDIELLLSEFTFGFSDGSFTLKPAAAAAGSDENFDLANFPSPAYVRITSGTDLFNGLVFELNGGGSTYTATLVGGGDITLAQKVLLEKLDRGDGYNALVPEAVFDADAGSLVFDFGTALGQADLANLTAEFFSDAGLTSLQAEIEIAADGFDTTLNVD